MTSLDDLVGECLMIGLKGPTVDDADVRLFRETRAAGLILYRRNFESPRQLLEMLARLEARMSNDPERELATAAGEQRAITRLRLSKLLEDR